MPESLFVRLEDDVVQPTAFARGPWDPNALHGGPVAALVAHVVEQLRSDEVDWFVARLTIELERPVPMDALRVHAEVTRPGRKVSIVEATITRADSGAALVRSRALRIRQADVSLPMDDPELAPLLAIEPPPLGPEHGHAGDVGQLDGIAFHNGGAEHRFIEGAGTAVGPVVDWIRLRVPLFPDVALTPLVRVARDVRRLGTRSARTALVPGRPATGPQLPNAASGKRLAHNASGQVPAAGSRSVVRGPAVGAVYSPIHSSFQAGSY